VHTIERRAEALPFTRALLPLIPRLHAGVARRRQHLGGLQFFPNRCRQKDKPHVPQMMCAGVFLAVQTLPQGFALPQRQRPRQALVIGGAIGVTLAIRAGGVLLFLYLLTAAVYAVFVRPRDDAPETPFRLRPMMFLNGGLLVLSAWILMVSIWPWAHENPFTRPLEAVRMSAAFHHTYQVVFAGQALPSRLLRSFRIVCHPMLPAADLSQALTCFGYRTRRGGCRRPPRLPGAHPGSREGDSWSVVRVAMAGME